MDGSKLPQTTWRKSSRSGQNGNCAEVTVLAAKVGVRDNKAPDAGHLSFSPQNWTAFVSNVRDGRYDLPEPVRLHASRSPSLRRHGVDATDFANDLAEEHPEQPEGSCVEITHSRRCGRHPR
ncbi:DUF397 domain-containing protein [Spirillospora sp. NPDC048832]